MLQNVCQQCHGLPTRNSAPFSLVTYADTQVIQGGAPIWRSMRTVVETGAMPLSPVQMADTDRQALAQWLDDGALPAAADDSCDAVFNDAGGGVEPFDGADSEAAGDDALALADSADEMVGLAADDGATAGEAAADSPYDSDGGTPTLADPLGDDNSVDASTEGGAFSSP